MLPYWWSVSLVICIAGLGEGTGGGGPERKRRKQQKRPLGLLEDGQMLSRSSMEVHKPVLQMFPPAHPHWGVVPPAGTGWSGAAVSLWAAVSLSHFNFRSNILAVLVPRMNSKALQGKVGCYCLTPTLVIIGIYTRLRTVGWGGEEGRGIPSPLPIEHGKKIFGKGADT